MKYPIYLGVTKARAAALGVNAIVNARAGEIWRNEMSDEDIALRRDGSAIKDRLQRRVRFYQVNSRFFRRPRNFARIASLVSRYDD